MKFGKKLLSLFLSIVMLMSMLGTTALAAGGSTNVEFTVDKSTAAIGDTITVVFKNKEMTVSSFTGGIKFDKDKLECTSIVGSDPEYPGDFGLTKKSGKSTWVDATAVSTVAQANTAGTVGFGYAGTTDVEYAASTLYTATFKVKDGASGTAVFTLYEDTAGTDAFKSDSIETKTVTIGSGGATATPVTAANFTMTGYEVGKKIVDLKVSGTNTGLKAVGDYGTGYMIGKDAAMTDSVGTGSTETFAAATDYYLVIVLKAADGHTLDGLKEEDVTLGTKTADELRLNPSDSTVAGAIFKLNKLEAPVADSYTITFNPGEGSGTMAPVTVTKAESGDTRWYAPECSFTAPDSKAFRVWQLGSDTTDLCPVGGRVTLTKDITLTAVWGTPLAAANFTLGGYEIGSSVKSAALTMDANTAAALESMTYGVTYAFGTDYSAEDGLKEEITEDSAIFEAGKTYYLAVMMLTKEGHSLNGLTKESVKLGGKAAHDLYKFGDGSYGTTAYFKLDPLSAPEHTHTKGTWVNEVPATCTATGTKGHFLCTGCDAKLDADGKEITDLTIAKNPDNHATDCVKGTEWKKDGTYHWHVYSKCGAVADKAEHSYTAGACVCGATHKDAQTITAENVNATYGDTGVKIVASAETTLSYAVNDSSDAITVDATTGALTINKAGTATVTITAEETTAYHSATKEVKITVAKKTLKIVGASPIGRPYEEGNLTMEIGSVGFDGLVGSEILEKGKDYTVVGTVETDTAASPKEYTAKVTLKGIADNNYVLESDTYKGNFTIYPADPIVPTGLTGKTGDKLSTVTLPEGWTWVEPETVMTEGTQTYKANYAGTVNYNAKSDVDLTVVVSDKTAQTITADNVTATYGETKSITASTTGDGALSYAVKSGADVVAVDADGKLTFKKAGTATVTVTAADTATYAKAIKDVTITVKKAAVTVTAKNQSIYVNGTAPDLTAADAYTVSGLVNGDTLTSISLVYAGTPDVTKAGSYDIVVTATVDESKYDLTTVNGKLTISNRPSSGGGGGGVSTYTITVDSSKNGTVTSSHKSAAKGTTVTITVKPDKGFELDTLTVTDGSGKKVSVTEKSGKFTFTMPASKVTVKATFAEIVAEPENPFVDVADDAYYFDAVLWAAEEGITGGTSATTFSPNATCTRAQAVTFLWRAAGSPAPKSTEMPFADVKADSYYYNAVLWAVENGITKGTSATTFSPDVECSRAQIVTFLWRSQKSPVVSAANPFADVKADAYYTDAVLWAAANGITGGTTATTFSPDMDCTRAQIVTFIYRCMK